MSLVRCKEALSAVLMLSLVCTSILEAQTKRTPRRNLKPTTKKQIADEVMAELGKLHPLDPEKKKSNKEVSSEDATPPADSAPMQELLDYWRHQEYRRPKNKELPSEIVTQRLLDACINRPNLCSAYLKYFPKTENTFTALYQTMQERSVEERESFGELRRYLRIYSPYFREELLESAQGLDTESLKILAERDWETALKVLEKKFKTNDPLELLSALGVVYEHVVKNGETAQVEECVAQFKEIVVGQENGSEFRGKALEILMQKEWKGQEEWFLSLFTDPVLNGLELTAKDTQNETPTSFRLGRPEELKKTSRQYGRNWLARATSKIVEGFVPKIIKLIGNSNPVVHNSAVGFLAEYHNYKFIRSRSDSQAQNPADYSQEIVQVLTPWLANKDWAHAPGRENFVLMVATTKIAACLPGLIAIVSDESEDREVLAAALAAIRSIDDPVTVPILKNLAPKIKDEEFRQGMIETIFLANGYSDEELVSAFEAHTRYAITLDSQGENAAQRNITVPPNVSIGLAIDTNYYQLTDGLQQRIFERIKALMPTEPIIAITMLSRFEHQKNRIAQLNLIERIRAGEATSDLLSYALSERRSFQKNVSNELDSMLDEGGYISGFASVMLGEDGHIKEILTGKDTKAQLALLVCARYVREQLPVINLIPFLSLPALTVGAEKYLEVENSRTARELIWARHPNQAWIIGESYGDFSPESFGSKKQMSREEREKKLQEEVLQGNDLDSIFAFLASGQADSPAIVVRVKKGEAEICVLNAKGFQKKRQLTDFELKELKSLTSQPEIEDLNPVNFTASGSDSFLLGQYLRVSKDSGRRIQLGNLAPAPKKDATPSEQLSGIFYTMSRSGDFKIRYDIEDKIKGLEVVYADEKKPIMGVGMEKKELRVYARNTEDSITKDSGNIPQWYVFEGGQFGGATTVPDHLAESYQLYDELDKGWSSGRNQIRSFSPIPLRKATYFTLDSPEELAGVYKLTSRAKPEKILSGNFWGVEVTADEQWLVTTRITSPEKPSSNRYNLVRVNLKTKEEFIVKLPVGLKILYPKTVLPGRGLILLTEPKSEFEFHSVKSFWFDAQTGNMQFATGDLRPLLQKSFLPFQPTTTPHTYWVAFNDNLKAMSYIGLYNIQNFTFKPLLELPGVLISNNSIWADEASGFVYFVHEGNLLRMPLK